MLYDNHPEALLKLAKLILLTALGGGVAGAQNCDFKDYKALDGLKAEMQAGVLQVDWQGERGR